MQPRSPCIKETPGIFSHCQAPTCHRYKATLMVSDGELQHKIDKTGTDMGMAVFIFVFKMLCIVPHVYLLVMREHSYRVERKSLTCDIYL